MNLLMENGCSAPYAHPGVQRFRTGLDFEAWSLSTRRRSESWRIDRLKIERVLAMPTKLRLLG